MLRKDMTPKPVYEQLHRLIHEEWQTSLSGVADAAGRYAFRGFRGAYRVAVELGGAKANQQFQLSRDSAQEITVVLESK